MTEPDAINYGGRGRPQEAHPLTTALSKGYWIDFRGIRALKAINCSPGHRKRAIRFDGRFNESDSNFIPSYGDGPGTRAATKTHKGKGRIYFYLEHRGRRLSSPILRLIFEMQVFLHEFFYWFLGWIFVVATNIFTNDYHNFRREQIIFIIIYKLHIWIENI